MHAFQARSLPEAAPPQSWARWWTSRATLGQGTPATAPPNPRSKNTSYLPRCTKQGNPCPSETMGQTNPYGARLNCTRRSNDARGHGAKPQRGRPMQRGKKRQAALVREGQSVLRSRGVRTYKQCHGLLSTHGRQDPLLTSHNNLPVSQEQATSAIQSC